MGEPISQSGGSDIGAGVAPLVESNGSSGGRGCCACAASESSSCLAGSSTAFPQPVANVEPVVPLGGQVQHPDLSGVRGKRLGDELRGSSPLLVSVETDDGSVAGEPICPAVRPLRVFD